MTTSETAIFYDPRGRRWRRVRRAWLSLAAVAAVLAARDSEARIRFDPSERNPRFDYDEEDGSHHTVWFLDAVTAYNQMRAAAAYRPAGFALWRLGSEDPSLWKIFGTNIQVNAPPDALRQMRYGYDIDFEGAGEILQVTAEPQDGARMIRVDGSTGLITSEDYTATPSGYVIRRTGDRPGLVALTFDDGPDPEWTPRVLDILKREGVTASFFIIGEDGQASPDLVRRIVAEGHDIGNHTYTHPNLGMIPGRLTDLELNATERLIESLTGRSTTLFRPPYFGDAEPTTPDEVEPIVRAQHLGYLTVGLHVDPDDWALPGADDLVRRTVEGVTNNSSDADQRGQVVLLHDGGGDRAETIAALPRIIHELRARGCSFVTVSELAGLSQAQTMPPVPWTLVSTGLGRLEHPAEYALTNLKQALFYYALFLLVDWPAAAFAFLLEKREQWSLLWWLFLQRFGYRQVMYTVMLKSVITAARGALVGWGKLERKATVTAQE